MWVYILHVRIGSCILKGIRTCTVNSSFLLSETRSDLLPGKSNETQKDWLPKDPGLAPWLGDEGLLCG